MPRQPQNPSPEYLRQRVIAFDDDSRLAELSGVNRSTIWRFRQEDDAARTAIRLPTAIALMVALGLEFAEKK